MLRRMRTFLAAVMGGAVLVAGLAVGVAVARADEPGATMPRDGVATASPRPRESGTGNMARIADALGISESELRQRLAAGATLPDLAAEFGVDPGDLDPPARWLGGGGAVVPGDSLLGRIGDLLGVDLNQVVDGLRRGHSPGDVLQSLGLDVDRLITNLQDLAQRWIDDAVAAGRLSEDQAAQLRTLVDRFVARSNVAESDQVSGPNLPRLPASLQSMLEQMGVNLDDLRAELRAGIPLDEALADLGVDVSQLEERAMNEALAHIDELEAGGQITPEQADRIRTRIENLDVPQWFLFNGGGPLSLHDRIAPPAERQPRHGTNGRLSPPVLPNRGRGPNA
jgi:polyhydroxyalkanoate synthesis regulator phasin